MPHREALRRIAEVVQHPRPDTVTQRELESHIDSLPEGWVDKESIREQLATYMDGARRLF